jgi:BirA family biotin operon repressor/biotin-[acetyl-CoA-carboxylase] ligase
MVDTLRAAEIQAVVAEKNKIALDLSVHQSIDSTNSWSMQQARLDRPLPFACFAEQQSQGRGRRGKSWAMKPRANIAMSLCWLFPMPASLQLLPLSVAVTIAETLEAMALDQVQIKWPNDVYVQGRKIAGILIETQPVRPGGKDDKPGPDIKQEPVNQGMANQGQLAVVIGVGLNFDMDDALLSQQVPEGRNIPLITDIHRQFEAQMIGHPPARESIAAELLSRIIGLCQNFEQQASLSLERFRSSYDYCMNKSIDLITDNEGCLSGCAQGISDEAELIVRMDGSNELRCFNSAEVSVRAGAG